MAKYNVRLAQQLWDKTKGWVDRYGTLTKKGNGEKNPKRMSVECGEDVHCISFMPDGAIHLHNHQDKKEVYSLITHDQLAFSDPKKSKLPTCLRLMRYLRDKIDFGSTYNMMSEWSIEPHLAGMVERAQARRKARTEFHKMVSPDIPSNFREAFFTDLQHNLSETWTKDETLEGYKTPTGNSKTNVVRVEFTNSFTGFPSIQGEQVINKSRYDRANYALIRVVVSQKWYVNCFVKSRWLINGLLVLDVIREFPNGTFLCTVGKPGHGYQIKPKQAIVDFTRERLSWVNDENKVSALMEGAITPRKRRTKAEMEASKNPAVLT